MKIEATWSPPTPLKKDISGKLIYTLDLSSLPPDPGVYVFCRKHGKTIAPIYIGETQNIRSRIASHLKSLPLMRAVENAASGSRFIIYCTLKTNSLAKAKKHIKIIERALILHAQGEGHEIFNKKGTKLPTDEISFIGNRTSEAVAPRTMLVKKALTASA